MAAVLKLICLAVVFTASKQQGTSTDDFFIESFNLRGHYYFVGTGYRPACSGAVCYVEEGHLVSMECIAGGPTTSLVTIKAVVQDNTTQPLPIWISNYSWERKAVAVLNNPQNSSYACEATTAENLTAGIRSDTRNQTIHLIILRKDDLLEAPFLISMFTITGKFWKTAEEGELKEVSYRPRQSEDGSFNIIQIPFGHTFVIECRSNGETNLYMSLRRYHGEIAITSGEGNVTFTARAKIEDSYNLVQYRCLGWKWPVGMESYRELERRIYMNVTQDTGLQPGQLPFKVDAFFVEVHNGTTWTRARQLFSTYRVARFHVDDHQPFRIKCRSRGHPHPYLAIKRKRATEPNVWRSLEKTYVGRELERPMGLASEGKQGWYKCVAWSPPSVWTYYVRNRKKLYLFVN